MADRVTVVGAGAIGLTCALVLARRGAPVLVLDAEAGAPNASAVAAGMLAPVSETLAEDADLTHLQRLFAARDLWPALADSLGLTLTRGLEFVAADAGEGAILQRRLAAWGLDAEPLKPPRLGVRLEDDWRLDARAGLAALRAAIPSAGGEIRRSSVTAAPGALLADGRPLDGPVVVAAGYSGRALAQAAPELALLTPIKGQLLAFEGETGDGPTLRSRTLYVAPQPSGARVGASMEAGRDDLGLDPDVLARLHAAAVQARPALAGAAPRGEAGVRAATPDGWPLAGPSATPGLVLATGGRRNGWLLAPLIAEIVAAAVLGEPPHPLAAAFHPGRFNR